MAQAPWRQNEGRSAASRGYDAAWTRISLQVRAEEPRCRLCGAPSHEVDHILPKAKGGTNARSNLRALCSRCHRTVTGKGSRPPSRRREAERHPGLV